jgi:hypothetical protein
VAPFVPHVVAPLQLVTGLSRLAQYVVRLDPAVVQSEQLAHVNTWPVLVSYAIDEHAPSTEVVHSWYVAPVSPHAVAVVQVVVGVSAWQ